MAKRKLSRSEQKDGLLEERARQALGLRLVYTTKTIHVQRKGKCLCGYTGKLVVNEELLIPSEMARCDRCFQQTAEAVREQMAVELRQYWQQPQHGGAAPVFSVIDRDSPPPTCERQMLPAEFLPTGSGRRVGPWR